MKKKKVCRLVEYIEEKNLLIQLYIMIVRKTALAFQKIMPTNYYVYTETILKYDIFQETCCFVKS